MGLEEGGWRGAVVALLHAGRNEIQAQRNDLCTSVQMQLMFVNSDEEGGKRSRTYHLGPLHHQLHAETMEHTPQTPP